MGRKDDQGKAAWDLLPFDVLDQVAAVFTHGAEKYGANNWREVPNGKDRYFAAFMRHMSAWKQGQRIDPDSGLPTIACAIASVMIIAGRENAIQTTHKSGATSGEWPEFADSPPN